MPAGCKQEIITQTKQILIFTLRVVKWAGKGRQLTNPQHSALNWQPSGSLRGAQLSPDWDFPQRAAPHPAYCAGCLTASIASVSVTSSLT